MASEIISAIVSRFQGVRRRYLWFRGEDRAQAVSAVRVMTRYGKCKKNLRNRAANPLCTENN